MASNSGTSGTSSFTSSSTPAPSAAPSSLAPNGDSQPPSNGTTNNPSLSPSDSNALTIGLSIGFVIALLAVAFLFWIFRWRNRSRIMQAPSFPGEESDKTEDESSIAHIYGDADTTSGRAHTTTSDTLINMGSISTHSPRKTDPAHFSIDEVPGMEDEHVDTVSSLPHTTGTRTYPPSVLTAEGRALSVMTEMSETLTTSGAGAGDVDDIHAIGHRR